MGPIFPDDIIGVLFSKIPPNRAKDAVRLSQTCRRYRELLIRHYLHRTALFEYASRYGNVELATRLLDICRSADDVEALFTNDTRAFRLACKHNQVDIILLFHRYFGIWDQPWRPIQDDDCFTRYPRYATLSQVSVRVNFKARMCEGIREAALRNNGTVVKHLMLVSNAFRPSRTDHYHLLRNAAIDGNQMSVQHLLKLDVWDVATRGPVPHRNVYIPPGEAPLRFRERHVVFVDREADLNVYVLNIAVYYGHAALVSFLVNTCHIVISDTALFNACKISNPDILRTLLTSGQPLNPNAENYKALKLIVQQDLREHFSILLAHPKTRRPLKLHHRDVLKLAAHNPTMMRRLLTWGFNPIGFLSSYDPNTYAATPDVMQMLVKHPTFSCKNKRFPTILRSITRDCHEEGWTETHGITLKLLLEHPTMHVGKNDYYMLRHLAHRRMYTYLAQCASKCESTILEAYLARPLGPNKRLCNAMRRCKRREREEDYMVPSAKREKQM